MRQWTKSFLVVASLVVLHAGSMVSQQRSVGNTASPSRRYVPLKKEEALLAVKTAIEANEALSYTKFTSIPALPGGGGGFSFPSTRRAELRPSDNPWVVGLNVEPSGRVVFGAVEPKIRVAISLENLPSVFPGLTALPHYELGIHKDNDTTSLGFFTLNGVLVNDVSLDIVDRPAFQKSENAWRQVRTIPSGAYKWSLSAIGVLLDARKGLGSGGPMYFIPFRGNVPPPPPDGYVTFTEVDLRTGADAGIHVRLPGEALHLR